MNQNQECCLYLALTLFYGPSLETKAYRSHNKCSHKK